MMLSIDTCRQVRRYVARMLDTMLDQQVDIKTTTGYLSPKLTVKLTRQRKPDRRDRSGTFLLSVGAPNYRERLFIKDCVNAGEKFPVRNIQLKFYPARKK